MASLCLSPSEFSVAIKVCTTKCWSSAPQNAGWSFISLLLLWLYMNLSFLVWGSLDIVVSELPPFHRVIFSYNSDFFWNVPIWSGHGKLIFSLIPNTKTLSWYYDGKFGRFSHNMYQGRQGNWKLSLLLHPRAKNRRKVKIGILWCTSILWCEGGTRHFTNELSLT